MFNIVYIKRDYTDYYDAFFSDDTRLLRFRSSEKLSSFLLRVSSYIYSGHDDMVSIWNIECAYEPIAVIEMKGNKECRYKLLVDDIYVSDLTENFMYCHLISCYEASSVYKTA